MTQRALAGMRVLEFGRGVAAPFCGKILADYGAEVIKIEPPEGDPARSLAPEGAAFAYLNAGKRGVRLDLGHEDGWRVALALAAQSDAVVENHGAAGMRSWGLDYDEVAAVNPGVVYTSISAFGRTGPYAGWSAEEIVVDAVGGWMYGLGSPDREPLKPPGLQSQVMGGLCAAMGTLAGYLAARASGVGDHLDVSQQEAVAWFLMNPTTVYEYSGSLWTRTGASSPTNYPQGIMPCKDGVIAVNVMYYAEWDRLCDLLEHPEWRTDPRLATPVDRVRNRQVIDEVLLPWLERMTPEEAFRVGQANKLPFSPVATVPDLLASDQLAARGFWIEQPDARLGEFVAPGLPFTLSGVEHAPPRPAPELGADTPDVLRDVLGSSAWELDRLRAAGVI